MKQSAVEWLDEKLNAIRLDVDRNVINFIDLSIQKAKEMEKEQQLELIQFLADREDFKEHSSMSIFIMKTFGLFILLFIICIITYAILLKDWTTPQIVTQSTIIAYIMQQYLTEQFKNK